MNSCLPNARGLAICRYPEWKIPNSLWGECFDQGWWEPNRSRKRLAAMKQTIPGRETCDEETGRLVPVVDMLQCETRGPCLEVCPYSVFEIRSLKKEEWDQFTWFPRMKIWLGGGRSSFVAKPDSCQACGLCVTACPQKAIKLKKNPNRKG